MTDDRMRVDVFMPLYVRDFIAATLGWSAEEKGHYLTLLMIQWDRNGLPPELDRLERLSPGVGAVWDILADKFPICEDGKRRNHRLESHRSKCLELKQRRSEAAKRGATARHNSSKRKATAERPQSDRRATAEQPQGNRRANASHPTPTPTPTPYPSPEPEKEHTHTQPESEFPERGHGWAAEAWETFADNWNRTERARPWTAFTPPDGWVDYASRPGWMEKASEAMTRLPACEFFEQPLAVTKFLDFVDRILAGEFDHAKTNGQQRRKPVGVRL